MSSSTPARLPDEQVLDDSEARLRQFVDPPTPVALHLESLALSAPVATSPLTAKEKAMRRLRANLPDAITRRLRRKGIEREQEESPLEAMSIGPRAFPDSAELSPTEIAVGLERIIGRNELLGIQYLEAGQIAARCIGRIVVRRGATRMEAMGTGFLVAPGLLMTNNHVLPTPESARDGIVEMNYQCATDGRQLEPVPFSLDPDQFFLTSDQRELDFTIVGVRETASSETRLSEFGFKTLSALTDEVLDGESVTIIQHPSGEPKQVALRENFVLKIPNTTDRYLYYQTDTCPGSSGSAVFNDDWEVVALHHSGYARRNERNEILARDGRVWTPAMGESQIDWIANEGIRVAAIVKHLAAQSHLDPVRGAALKRAFRVPEAVVPPERESSHTVAIPAPADVAPAPALLTPPPAQTAASSAVLSSGSDGPATIGFSLNIPLQISISLGDLQTPQRAMTTPTAPAAFEKIEINTDYDNRAGYDPAFLGSGNRKVPLPKLHRDLEPLAARLTEQRDPQSPFELKYHHYSIVMNAKRKLAFFTAVNIDGIDQQQLDKREKDKWIFDRRIPVDAQIGNDWYSRPFDRGHLVRRLDPAWGRSVAIAKQANDDTFHFTNCSPQHSRFNQGKNLWQGLENYLLDTANKEDRRISVFTGPVFLENDPVFAGVQIPRQFWKVAAWVRPNGTMGAAAFLVSQADLLSDMGLESTGEQLARTFQTTIGAIEQECHLNFGTLSQFDTFSRTTSPLEGVAGTGTLLESFDQIVL